MKSSEKQIEKIDLLFKNKLDDHSIDPSENAWARVEAELSKKNNLWLGTTRTVVLWRSAAAVLILGAIVSMLYWSQTRTTKGNNLVKKSPVATEVKKDVAQTKAATKNEIDQPVQKKIKVEQQERVDRLVNPENPANKELAQQKEPSESRKKIIEIENEIAQGYSFKLEKAESDPVASKEEKIKTEATPQAEVASTRQKPIKLEFTLDALPSEETVATTTEVKSTGIQKVLNLAREVKQGEGLSSLRDKKDELLAHNFLTKRERNQ